MQVYSFVLFDPKNKNKASYYLNALGWKSKVNPYLPLLFPAELS